jgi:hypothetical protein
MPAGRPRIKPTASICECQKTCFAPTTGIWVAIVDVENAKLLQDYHWTAIVSDRSFYAVSKTYKRDKGTTEMLHQACTNHIHKRLDHESHNGHDCRLVNLRPASHAQGTQRKRELIRGNPPTSKFKGVSKSTNESKWRARIAIDGRKIELGYFATELEAAHAYNAAASEHFGAFAKLNKLPESD